MQFKFENLQQRPFDWSHENYNNLSEESQRIMQEMWALEQDRESRRELSDFLQRVDEFKRISLEKGRGIIVGYEEPVAKWLQAYEDTVDSTLRYGFAA